MTRLWTWTNQYTVLSCSALYYMLIFRKDTGRKLSFTREGRMKFLTVYTPLRWTVTRREPNEELHFVHYRRGHSLLLTVKSNIYLCVVFIILIIINSFAYYYDIVLVDGVRSKIFCSRTKSNII